MHSEQESSRSRNQSEPTRTLYLEGSIFARAVEEGISGARLRERLQESGWEPVTGQLVIDTLFEGIQHPLQIGSALRQLKVVAELRPAFTRESAAVIRQEINYANGGPAVRPLVRATEQVHLECLVQRHAADEVDHPEKSPALQRARQLQATHQDLLEKIRKRAIAARSNLVEEFEDGPLAAGVAGEMLGYPPAVILAKLLAPGHPALVYRRALERIDELPHLRVRLNQYDSLFKVVLDFDTVEDVGEFLDCGHFTDAAYCDGLASGEPELEFLYGPPERLKMNCVLWDQLGFESSPRLQVVAGRGSGAPHVLSSE